MHNLNGFSDGLNGFSDQSGSKFEEQWEYRVLYSLKNLWTFMKDDVGLNINQVTADDIEDLVTVLVLWQ